MAMKTSAFELAVMERTKLVKGCSKEAKGTYDISAFDSSGIPQYIGGDSLTSVCTIDSPLTPTFAEDPENWCRGPEDQRYQDSNGEFSDLVWVWKVSSLPNISEDIPLERTALRLRELPLSTVTSRISSFMRCNSISCSYHTDEARVYCLTNKCLKFVVQLWQDPSDQSAIILEVQRRRGCCIAMRSVRRCFYKSLAAGTQEILPELSSKHASFRRLSTALKNKFRESEHQEEFDKKCRQSKARIICIDLLESKKKDENRLGMESLLALTDSSKVHQSDAYELARALIYNDGCLAGPLRDCLVSSVSRECDETELWESNESDDSSWFEPSNSTDLGDTHLLALKVLVGCLELVVSTQRDYLLNEATLLQLGSSFWHDIASALVYYTREARHHPQEAALSIKCFRLLEVLEPEGMSPFLEEVICPLLSKAHKFGKAHHRALEQETKETMQCLGQMEESLGQMDQRTT